MAEVAPAGPGTHGPARVADRHPGGDRAAGGRRASPGTRAACCTLWPTSRARRACSWRPPPRARTCGASARTRSPPRAPWRTGRPCSACWRKDRARRCRRSCRRWCEAGNVDACAVLADKTVVAVSGPALDWQQIVTAGAEQGATFLAPAGHRARAAARGARRPAEYRRSRSTWCGAWMSGSRARSAPRSAPRCASSTTATTPATPVNAFTALYSAALADGRSAVQRIDAQEVYAASVPRVRLQRRGGGADRRALLPVSAVDAPARSPGEAAADRGARARGAGGARRRAPGSVRGGPGARADRGGRAPRGQGDFSTSIPPGGAAEVGTLARTMEDMRRNLIELTEHAAAARGRGAGGARRHRRGRLRGRPNRLIRYLNPQAAEAAGRHRGSRRSGRFCGDVLKPQAEDGRRPCEARCPILAARSAGQRPGHRAPGAAAGRAAHHGHHQRRAGRWPAGAGDPRRDRARGRAARARLGARQHLARVPHAARRAARLHRAAARRAWTTMRAGAAARAGDARSSAARCASRS